MNKQMEMIDILQEECRKDSELLDMIIEEYVMGLNAFEEANLEDFIVNNRLIEQQGEDAPAAAFIFTNADVFIWDEGDGDQMPVERQIASDILNEIEDYDHIYTEVFDLIEEELKARNLIEND